MPEPSNRIPCPNCLGGTKELGRICLMCAGVGTIDAPPEAPPPGRTPIQVLHETLEKYPVIRAHPLKDGHVALEFFEAHKVRPQRACSIELWSDEDGGHWDFQ